MRNTSIVLADHCALAAAYASDLLKQGSEGEGYLSFFPYRRVEKITELAFSLGIYSPAEYLEFYAEDDYPKYLGLGQWLTWRVPLAKQCWCQTRRWNLEGHESRRITADPNTVASIVVGLEASARELRSATVEINEGSHSEPPLSMKNPRTPTSQIKQQDAAEELFKDYIDDNEKELAPSNDNPKKRKGSQAHCWLWGCQHRPKLIKETGISQKQSLALQIDAFECLRDSRRQRIRRRSLDA